MLRICEIARGAVEYLPWSKCEIKYGVNCEVGLIKPKGHFIYVDIIRIG